MDKAGLSETKMNGICGWTGLGNAREAPTETIGRMLSALSAQATVRRQRAGARRGVGLSGLSDGLIDFHSGYCHTAAIAGRRLGFTPRVAVRVNPDFELKGSSMKMGGGAKQFGVDAERMPEAKTKLPARIVIELGRYLVGEAGEYVCRALDRKISRDQVFLVTDGGLHHNLSASGKFGQVIRKNYPVAVGNRVDGADTEVASVVGPLCTHLDVLGDKSEITRADVCDLIVVFQSGAYGLTASPTAFLSHPSPAEILV